MGTSEADLGAVGRLPRELTLGRAAMAAFLTVVAGRQLRPVLVGELPGTRSVAVCAGVAVLSVAWLYFWTWRAGNADRPANAISALLTVGSAILLVAVNPTGVYPMYYAAVLVGAAYPWRVGSVLVGLVTVATVVVWTRSHQPFTIQVPFITLLLGGSSVIVRRYVAAYVELQVARGQLERLAATEARADLARDLHDRVGQQLSAVVLQGELLRAELAGVGSSAVCERAGVVVDTARAALQGMRDVVSRERGPGLAAEAEVARQLLEASGTRCSVDVDAAAALTPEVDRMLVWVLREGTSNVMRHSGASCCTVVLRHRDGTATLDIADDGEASGDLVKGNGLRGVEERLHEVGGTLTLSSAAPRGFSLLAEVPVPATAR